MRFVVFGAGAIGSGIGGHLHRTGHDALIVGRPAHVNRIRKHGLKLVTDEQTYTLSVPAVAHAAVHEGVTAAEDIAGKRMEPIHQELITRCTYSHPQIASVGMTEKEARDKGIAVKVGKFPFLAIGRALIHGEPDGFVKIVADETGHILGTHIVNEDARGRRVLHFERGRGHGFLLKYRIASSSSPSNPRRANNTTSTSRRPMPNCQKAGLSFARSSSRIM